MGAMMLHFFSSICIVSVNNLVNRAGLFQVKRLPIAQVSKLAAFNVASFGLGNLSLRYSDDHTGHCGDRSDTVRKISGRGGEDGVALSMYRVRRRFVQCPRYFYKNPRTGGPRIRRVLASLILARDLPHAFRRVLVLIP